jgi:hypothetical protein
MSNKRRVLIPKSVAVDKIVREAQKKIRLYQRMIVRLQEMQPGDYYYWKKMGLLLKIITVVCSDDDLGRVEVRLLAAEKPRQRLSKHIFLVDVLYKGLGCIHCVEWKKVSVRDFPLFINCDYKSKEFYRLLAKGEP